jgi:hypothetical protein
MKLIRKEGRKFLNEGRSSGISYALCKRVRNRFYEIMPLSACKDYLNDAIFAENQNKTTPLIYGFSHTPVGILKYHTYIYMSVANLTSEKDEDPTLIDEKELNNSLLFINTIENKLNLKKTSVINTDLYHVLKIDKFWGTRPYLISAYGLLFREGIGYNGSISVEDYISNLTYKVLNTKVYNKFLKLASELPEQNTYKMISDIHNKGGIANYK